MQLYNSLTKTKEDIITVDGLVTIYTCGPTVYDFAHIGNLRAYIMADTLKRAVRLSGQTVKHVMNTTDIDDKTIRRSQEEFPSKRADEALTALTDKYTKAFLQDAADIGIDYSDTTITPATQYVDQMRTIIMQLLDKGIAYEADDGIYFSLKAYVEAGNDYGVFLGQKIEALTQHRISNDEYDKEQVADFALWKKAKPGEPTWTFTIGDEDFTGRPGWHIECSAMSTAELGQPISIHTGAVDNKFPHHENEIAQTTGANGELFAHMFVHNEHLLVDGAKMAKSKQNFYRLNDVRERGYDLFAFRILILQAHYRTRLNFSWGSLDGAQAFLQDLTAMADRQWQPCDTCISADWDQKMTGAQKEICAALADDMDTPRAMATLSGIQSYVSQQTFITADIPKLQELLGFIDRAFGLNLLSREDITDEQKQLVEQREQARNAKNFDTADTLRDQLAEQGLAVSNTASGAYWYRTL